MNTTRRRIGSLYSMSLALAVTVTPGLVAATGCGTSGGDGATVDVATRRADEDALRRARQNLSVMSDAFGEAAYDARHMMFGVSDGVCPPGSGCISYTIQGLAAACTHSVGTCTFTDLATWAGDGAEPATGSSSAATNCAQAVCLSEMALCASHRYLELSSEVNSTQVTTMVYTGQAVVAGTASVAPSTAEQRTALLAEARGLARAAVSMAGEALRRGMSLPESGYSYAVTCAPGTTAGAIGSYYTPPGATDQRTYAESLSMLFIEGAQVAEEAGEGELEVNGALAAAELSRERDPAEAMRKSWTDPVYSLGVGAQAILGGVLSENDTIPNAGLCATNDDRHAVEVAIGLLRMAGGLPARVFDLAAVSNPALFQQTSTSACTDTAGYSVPCSDTASVCKRLAERLGDTSLDGDCFAMLTEDNGLTDADITDARLRMRSLAIAFPVSNTAVLPALAIGGGTTSFARYAATANSPTPVHPLYYATLARFGANNGASFVDAPSDDWSSTSSVPVSPAIARRGSAGTLAYALSVAHAANAATANQLPTGTVASLATLLGAVGSDDGANRVEVCHDQTSASTNATHTVRFRVFDGRGPVDNTYRVVVGADGLRCAVQGSLNGATCDPLTYTANVLSAYPPFYVGTAPTIAQTSGTFGTVGTPDAYASGPNAYTELLVTLPRGPSPGFFSQGNILLFVVKKGAAGNVAGGFEPVAGYRVPFGLSDTKNRCAVVPFFNSGWDEAGSALTPSTTRCGRPSTSCAGTREDGPIPLENELSADGDDFESSWRHYLDEARRAASLADTLGEQVIEYGLANDGRTEGAEDELESTCGTASGIGALLPGDLGSSRGVACTVAEGAPCSAVSSDPLSDYICRGGFCVGDPAKLIARRSATDSAFEGLSECLSDDSVVAYVGLGDKPLCAWELNGTLCDRNLGSCSVGEGLACTVGADSGFCLTGKCMFDGRCPLVASDAGDCSPAAEYPMPATTAATRVLVQKDGVNSRMLGLFVAPTPVPLTDSRADTLAACAGLRQLRTNYPALTDRARIDLVNQVAPHFQLERVAEYARAIGWEARPFSNSAITFAGAPLFETDNPLTSGAPTGWPCAQLSSTTGLCSTAITGVDHPSLFCASIGSDCGANVFPLAVPPDPETPAKTRSRMNERMARAVLTLRALTNTGFSGIVAPYRPSVGYVSYRSDKESEGWGHTEGASFVDRFYAVQIGGPGPVTFYNGTSAGPPGSAGSGYDYHGFELDGPTEHDDYQAYTAQGTSYCWSSEIYSNKIWYWPSYDAGRHSCTYGESDGACGFLHGTWPVMYRASEVNAAPAALGGILPLWQGLDDDPNTAASTVPAPSIARMMYLDDGTIPWFPGSAGGGDPFSPLLNTFVGADFGNELPIYPGGDATIGSREVLDALELACEIEAGTGPVSCADLPTPTASNLNDLGALETYMGCIADDMRERASKEILTNVPRAALDGLEPGYEFSGTRGAAASRVSQGLIGLRRYPREMADSIAGMRSDIRTLRLKLRGSSVRGELISLSEASAISSNVAACLKTVGSAMSAEVAFGGAAESAAQCADSAMQIAIAIEKASLEAEEESINTEIDWVSFSAGFRDRAAALKASGDALASATTELRGGLADLETSRQTGLRALARALLADSDAAGRYYPVNTVMRRRFNTAKVRYERQLEYAKKMAWMARRAVEQRLGMRLDEMRTDMSFVAAPATWADELCTFRGVDYARIRAGGGDGPDNYADAYIGDYVENLARVVESYQQDYPFHEASDTAVVSLRDDILGVKAFCDQPVPNLLAYSGRLDRLVAPGAESRGYENPTANPADAGPDAAPTPVPDGGPDGSVGIAPPTYLWARTGCSDASSTACIAVSPFDIAASRRPWGESSADGPAFRVTFNPGLPGSGTTPTALAALEQVVWLAPGTYRLSWYRFDGEAGAGASVLPVIDMAEGEDGGVIVTNGGVLRDSDDGTNVLRFHRFVSVGAAGADTMPVRVRLMESVLPTTVPLSFVVGGLMLEDVTSLYPTTLPPGDLNLGHGDPTAPGSYIGTIEPGVGRLQLCEDTTGAEFRRKWHHDCTRLCAGGWGSCTLGPTHCFWETSFSITPESLERGGLFRRAGFAYGNFNYRMRSVTVNAVGTGVRSCADSAFPSTCYSDGSIRYSIEHTGPFTVTNHLGEYYDAPLFTGAIEHGRALAAERYITNPISSADRTMIDQYRHTEMRGRPLAGNYTVRIWDEEGIQFSNIEDVQVILEYGYWTRLR